MCYVFILCVLFRGFCYLTANKWLESYFHIESYHSSVIFWKNGNFDSSKNQCDCPFFYFWDFWLFWKLPSGQRDLNIDKLTSFDTLDRFPEHVAIYSIWSFQITPYDPFKLRSRSPFSVFQSFCSSRHWRIVTFG